MLKLVSRDDWVVYDTDDPTAVIRNFTEAEARAFVVDIGNDHAVACSADNYRCMMAEDHP